LRRTSAGPHVTRKASFRQRIVRAGSWTLGGDALAQIIRFAGNLLMTRLLVPEMFGVMAVASTVIHGIGLFSDLGLRQSVIQSKRGNDPEFLNTAWLTQIYRGLLIFGACAAASAGLYTASRLGLLPRGSTFAEPVLPLVLAVVSFTAVISGFESTKMLVASRDLALGRVTAIELVSQAGGLLATILYALAHRSIWALVVGGLVAASIRALLSHWAMPGPANRLQWHRESFTEIFGFGKWIFASSLLGALLGNGDRLLLGALVSAEALGLYSIAFLLLGAIKNIIQKIVSRVVYPAVSETARERPAELGAHYYKMRTPIDLLCLFLLGFLHVAGSGIVDLLYDSRYQLAGHHLAILSWSLFTFRFSIAGHCYIALGKPHLLTMLIALSTVVLYLTVPLGYNYFGLDGALWAIALNAYVGLPLMIYINHQNGLWNLRKELLLLGILPVGIAAGYAYNALHSLIK